MRSRRTSVRGGIFLIVFLLLLPAVRADAGRVSEAWIDGQIRAIENNYGVRVHYKPMKDIQFPEHWRRDPTYAKVEPMPIRKMPDIIGSIRLFLSKYPRNVIKDNLADIYLTGKLVLRGKVYGGTYYRNGIYLPVKGRRGLFSNEKNLRTLAHEFSSILMNKHPFPSQEWQAANPSGFEYSGSGYDFLGKKRPPKIESWINSQGFINEYAQTNVENDFNELSELLFMKRAELKSLAKRYPRIKKKMELAIGFYESIDRGFKF